MESVNQNEYLCACWKWTNDDNNTTSRSHHAASIEKEKVSRPNPAKKSVSNVCS